MKLFIFLLIFFTSITSIAEESTVNAPADQQAEIEEVEPPAIILSEATVRKALHLQMVQSNILYHKKHLNSALTSNDTSTICPSEFVYGQEVERLKKNATTLKKFGVHIYTINQFKIAAMGIFEICKISTKERRDQHFKENRTNFEAYATSLKNTNDTIKQQIKRANKSS